MQIYSLKKIDKFLKHLFNLISFIAINLCIKFICVSFTFIKHNRQECCKAAQDSIHFPKKYDYFGFCKADKLI